MPPLLQKELQSAQKTAPYPEEEADRGLHLLNERHGCIVPRRAAGASGATLSTTHPLKKKILKKPLKLGAGQTQWRLPFRAAVPPPDDQVRLRNIHWQESKLAHGTVKILNIQRKST